MARYPLAPLKGTQYHAEEAKRTWAGKVGHLKGTMGMGAKLFLFLHNFGESVRGGLVC